RAVGAVPVTASPTLVPAAGGSSLISAFVFDINGNPLPTAPVSFSTNAGTLEALLRTVTAGVGATAPGAAPPTTTTPPGSTTPPSTTPTTPTASGQASGSVTVNIAGAPTLLITPPTTPPTAGL